MVAATDLPSDGRLVWTARPDGRILRLATADQDRPGLTGLYLLDGRRWRHLVRRSPREMLEEVLGDAAVAAALTDTSTDRSTVARLSVEG
jgi:hypothetical protein